jgi:long-chain-fatty-acid--[acyl-carrier-protein] ligase
MRLAIRYLVWLLFRLILSLRYRIRVHGLEGIESLKANSGPILILPNHPGYVDPPVVLTALWPRLHPRPLLLASMFDNPVLRPMLWILEAIQVPDLDRASSEARAQTEQAVAEVIAGLKAGRNHILWPSGRVQRDGSEKLGPARALADILQAVPNAQVLLVRTRGVWGSSFSYAYTGQAPDLINRLVKGVGCLLANLVFFTPRRHVNLTVEQIDQAHLPELRREVLNPWLEHWYNPDGPEEPTFVPYHFLFGKRHYQFPELEVRGEVDLARITPETRTAVNDMLEEQLQRPLTDAEKEGNVKLDSLGLDSLQRMELGLSVEHRFGFTGEEVPETVGELWALAQGIAPKSPPRPAPPQWHQPPTGSLEPLIQGQTIAEAFVRVALTHRKDIAVADDQTGAFTYERLLVGALLLSQRFARLEGHAVGVMLPSSVGCDLALFGLFLAGKIPVLLNWTTGPGNLAHAAQIMNLTHVITSKQFVDRTGVQVEGGEYLFMETLGQQIGKFERLWALLRVRYRPGSLLKELIPPAGSSDPGEEHAVVLFTSGSEKAPKAVPLTHRNLLSDQRAVIEFFHVTRQDSVLSFLPAFHSFGLSITGLLPLLSGIRVVHHPDPTDSLALAHKVASYRPTILMGTPTFVGYILDRAKPEQLGSLRMILVGAEKCPPSLFERCARMAPAAHLLEGYGITECSPVVSVNRPEDNRPGTVGKALPGVEVRAVDLDTEEALPANQQGMLHVAGPTIFPGYIAHEGPSPFVEQEGKRWYVTGDLACLDEDGYIHFVGRLKRFLKAGGEMISLPALEEPIARRFPADADGPRVAVEGVETESGRRIVLFTTETLSLRDANNLLLQEGFRGVMRLDEVQQVESLPVLGTGKTDYKVLRARIAEGLRGKGPEPVRSGAAGEGAT